MCGINGIIEYSSQTKSQAINFMNNCIIHRGPDDEGLYEDRTENYVVGLGMRRLSIIDLTSGNQPMFSSDGKVVIVFNGEIYNFQKLRADLISEGRSFETHSDTEVILQLYLKYGVDAFSLLDGMYSFCIYDKRIEKIFITRDYFGEKPLYYSLTDDLFIWGSELKSIISQLKEKPNISKNGLELYFALTYIPAPFSIYDGIYKLESNTYIDYSISKKKTKLLPISKAHNQEQFTGSFSEAKSITEKIVEDSVKSRSISDVPIGTFLSGGVDSSIISLCLSKNSVNKINTFSIGFDKEDFDETQKSRTVAKLINSNHHEFILNEKSLETNLDDILNHFDEPFADSSALPTYLVSKMTSEHVKVALTGDGGDEVFGGYNKYYISKINSTYTKYIPKKLHSYVKELLIAFLSTKDDNRGLKFKLKKSLESINYDGNFYWNMISLGFKETEVNRLLNSHSNDIFSYFKETKNLTKSETLSDLRLIDKHLSLEGDMLVKVDRMSMKCSLECRAPFLNKKIWDFTNSLPENYLIHQGSKKFILKEAFKGYFPDNFLNISKKGFGVPVGDWLRSILKDELLHLSQEKLIIQQNLFNYKYVNRLIDRHITRTEDNTFKLWTFYCFQKWYYQNKIQ